MKKLLIPILIFTFQIVIGQSKALPDFKLESINGDKVTLSELLKTGAVYINFWALWCVPCRAELKALQLIHDKFEDRNVHIIAINIDSPKSSAKVKSFISSQKYSFLVLLDTNQEVFQKFNGTNLPYSLLIDRSGKIVKVRKSYIPGDEKEIIKDIESLLN